MSERPTPETDNLARGNHVVPTEWAEQLERKLAEAREKAERYRIKANAMMMQRDEALAQVKELIYISDRAIALAEIDFENDKFGVVSELRDGLEKIKGEQ